MRLKAAGFMLRRFRPASLPDSLHWANAWRKFGGRLRRERTRLTWSSRARMFLADAGPVHMKVILGTGDLLTLRNIARASFVAMMAGADFIKTSTGKEPTNATLPVSLVMVRAIREYAQQTGMAVGFKPAGGIRTAKQSIDWLAMMKEELGDSWLRAEMFRFGASGLLGDIERQLEHHATGRYSAEYRHPIA
jgi:deoxyribose-phosphate aldolase